MAKSEIKVSFIGMREFRRAVKRNPARILNEAQDFLNKGLAIYKSGINNDPWRVGSRGGGVPVSNDPRFPRKLQRSRSGNLRDTHQTKIEGLKGRIFPNQRVANYAKYVHSGTRFMKARPWLDYVKRNKQGEIENLFHGLLKGIVKDLAR